MYALVVFALASVLFFTRALRVQAARALEGAPELIVQRMAAGRRELAPARWLDAVAWIRGGGAALLRPVRATVDPDAVMHA